MNKRAENMITGSSFTLICNRNNASTPEVKMSEITFDEAYDSYCNELYEEHAALADALGITRAQASDVLYLRTRYRWTQDLENELIELYKNGETPLIYDFGVNKQSKERMMKEIFSEIAAKYSDSEETKDDSF